jgi:hypothetical protein
MTQPDARFFYARNGYSASLKQQPRNSAAVRDLDTQGPNFIR